jgi:glycosyltransferase involved in cell wall biosynthesis
MSSPLKPIEETRIAWLAPSLARGWRWQSLFKEFYSIFPNTVIFTGFWPGSTKGFEGTFRIEQIPGCRPWGAESRPAESGNRYMWASPRILPRLLRFRPKIILTNGFHLWTICALLSKALLRSRLILLWQGVSRETGGGAGSLRLMIRRCLARFFDLAVTNTEDGARYLEETVGIPPERVKRLVGEVADQSSFIVSRPIPFDSLARPVFLYVGRLVHGKGIEQLLTACSILVRQGIKDFSVLVAGDGPCLDNLRRLVQELGLERQVRWEGFVLYEELGAFYRACDVFVLPSLEDTWGVAVLEAMAFSKPALVSCYAGAREMIQRGVNGFVFDPLRPHDLAGAMRKFIQHPEHAAQLGKASGNLMAGHTPRRVAEHLAHLVCQTLDTETAPKAVLKPAR